MKGKLKQDENYICSRCSNPVPDSTAVGDFSLDGASLEVVPTFTYLGDVIGDNGGCADAITGRIRSAWKKFSKHLPILTNKGILLKSRGKVFTAAVCGVLLHASETWAVTVEDTSRIVRNDHTMIRWICSSKIMDKIPMQNLRRSLGIGAIDVVLRCSRLRWYGHLTRM